MAHLTHSLPKTWGQACSERVLDMLRRHVHGTREQSAAQDVSMQYMKLSRGLSRYMSMLHCNPANADAFGE